MAAAAQPQDLGKRQRKKVSYNEANLARDKTASPSDSEYSGSDAVEDDEDGSSSGLELEGEEGKKVSYPPPKGKQRQGLSSLLSPCNVRLQKSDGPLCGALQKERKAKEAAEKEVPQWKVYEVRALVEALLQHGKGRTTATRAAVRALLWILSPAFCVMAKQAVCLLVNCSLSGVGCQLH